MNIKVLNVKITPEDEGGSPLTECMEKRVFTCYAQTPDWAWNSSDTKYKFYYQKANGSWQNIDTSSQWYKTQAVVTMDEVKNAPTPVIDHHFTAEVYVEATYKGVTAKSSSINMDVYRLWIEHFRDSATKDWKVCVGSPISYKGVASNDCERFSWIFPEKNWSRYWKTTGGDAKEGNNLKITYGSLASASNSWFGETYGTVRFSCYGGDGRYYEILSTNLDTAKKASVFFSPDKDVNGTTNFTQTNPPNWFRFWKNGNVIAGIGNFGFSSGQNVIARHVVWGGGLGGSGIFLGQRARTYEIVATGEPQTNDKQGPITLTRYGGNDQVTLHTTPQKYLEAIAGAIRHELYHKHVWDSWGSLIGTGSDPDSDGLPTGQETAPTSYEGVVFPFTEPGHPDTFRISEYPRNGFDEYATYGDAEIRCRMVQSEAPMTIYPERDWAADINNPKWGE